MVRALVVATLKPWRESMGKPMIKSHKFILNDGRILLVTGYDYTLSIVDPLVDEPEEVPCFDTYPAPPPIPPTPGPNASLQEKAEWRDAIGR
jgi:hypothetical protein